MANKLVVTLFILVVYVTAAATLFVYAAKSPESTTKEHEATKEGDASAPEASPKGSAKEPEAAPKGSDKVSKVDAKRADAGGPGAPMTWPDGGPEFVEMVIKNPFLKSTPPSSSDGLPTDPTPEGSSNGLPIDPTPEGSMT